MKQLLLSGTIALGVHIIFFLSVPMLLQKRSEPVKPEIKSIMVSMSYLPVEEKKEIIKETPIKKIVKKSIKRKIIIKPKSQNKIRQKKINPLQVLAPKKIEPFQKADLNPQSETDIKQEVVETKPVNVETPAFKNKEVPDKSKKLSTMTEPFYKNRPLLKYPAKAKRRGYEGTVELMVQVSEKGKVSNLWVYKSSNYKSLDNQALKIVKKWIFEPGKKNGKPEIMWVKIPVKFKLKS